MKHMNIQQIFKVDGHVFLSEFRLKLFCKKKSLEDRSGITLYFSYCHKFYEKTKSNSANM